MASILDQLERTTVSAKDIIAENSGATEELNPQKYAFLMEFCFIPQIFTEYKIRQFTEDVGCVFDAHLSEYEIFLRQMDTNIGRLYADIPVIEPDNMQMLKASNMDVVPDSFPAENVYHEKWFIRLFIQFNMPTSIPTVFRTFTELSSICEKYKICSSETCSTMRMNKQDVQIKSQNTHFIDEYSKYRDQMMMDGVDVSEMDERFSKLVATSVCPVTVTYTFREEVISDWKEMRDFEYIFDRKIRHATGFTAEICQNMFNRDLKDKIDKYLKNRIDKFGPYFKQA